MMQHPLNRLMLTILNVCLLGGVIFLVSIYWAVPFFARMAYGALMVTGFRYGIAMACWYMGTAGGIALLWTLRRMVLSLQGDPFVQQNVKHLRNLGYIALLMAACSLLAALLSGYLLLVAIGMMLAFCALLSLVLKNVFQKAVEYRDENELVI